MVKLKTAAFTFMTLCLLILGALLPTFVGKFQNQQVVKSGLEAIQTGNLKMKETMTLTDKLHVLANFQTYPLSDQTLQTENSLWEAVDKGLQPYIDRELFGVDWNVASRYATPSLAYRTDAPDVHFSVWSVTIEDGDGNLGLTVDDETGAILTVAYASKEMYPTDFIADKVSWMKDAYFESTGLSQDDWDITVSVMDQNYAEAICIYYGQNFDRVELEFSFFSNGCWTYILE